MDSDHLILVLKGKQNR